MLRILKKPISVLILVGLISFFILLLHAVFINKPFTTIQKVYPQSIFLERKEGELLKGDTAVGSFLKLPGPGVGEGRMDLALLPLKPRPNCFESPVVHDFAASNGSYFLRAA